MERPIDRHSISMRQPWPAMSRPPMERDSGMKMSFAVDRAVLERRIEREMAAPDLQPGVSRGTSASEMPMSRSPPSRPSGSYMRNATPISEATGAGDVALVEREPEAQHFLAVPLALAHDAVVGDRGRVGTGERPGQREARHVAAVGQARQVMALLLVGAVMHQQLPPGRASSVRRRWSSPPRRSRRSSGSPCGWRVRKSRGRRIPSARSCRRTCCA